MLVVLAEARFDASQMDKVRSVARPMIEATLSGDHRVSDGHRGGRFLLAVDRLLQEPEKL